MKPNVRNADIVVRYGGDEFLIMFPETDGEADVARARILAALDELNAGSRFSFSLILALGSAHWDPNSEYTVEQTRALADERMYEHKKGQHESTNRSS